MNESFCVYVHTFPNGKRYIGQCKEPAEARWKNGNGYLRQKLIHNAIVKYGWGNVTHEIVCSGISREQAYQREAELIKELNTNAVNGGNGYNMSDGGESGSKGYRHTEEHKALMSQLQSGENNGFYGKKHSKETRQKISTVHKGKVMSEESRRKMSESRSGENHPQYGKHCSEETKQKLRKANLGEKHPQFGMRGRDNPHTKSFLCVETGEVFGCLSEIADSLKSDVSHVSAVCRGRRKKACGYHWEYAKQNILEKG